MNNKGKVLIISSKETFSVRGMETKLGDIGCVGEFVTAKTKALLNVADEGASLIVYYMDESVYEDASFLVCLKDLVMEKEKDLFLVGNKGEYNEVKKFVPEQCISRWFERPLDMSAFLEEVVDYMDRERLRMMKKTVLIVDDDVAYMQMVREWLKDTYQVVMVSSGIKAIRYLTKNKADLVLLDYAMPVTDGPQIFEMLKSDNESDNIPVMFLTGQQNRESVMRAAGLKPVDYLLKDIDRNSLLEKIEQYFEAQKNAEKIRKSMR